MKDKKDKKKGSKSIDIKQLLMDIFTANPKRSFNYKQMTGLTGLVKKTDRQKVAILLNEMVTQGLLTEVVPGKFKLLMREAYVTGKVDMTASGAAYIVPEDGGEDIFVAQSNLNQALHGDVVKVLQYAQRRRHQPQGEVVEIIKRKRDTFVGTLEVAKNFAFLITDRKVMYQDIFIPLNKLNGGQNGQKAVAKITDWPANAKNPYGEIIDVLGDAGENQTEMHAILAEFNLPYRYPDHVNAEAEKIDAGITPEEIANRRDFRDITTFTIDPEDAKDFDDALSVRQLPDGEWEVGVHIADVTHYVKEDSIMENEAFFRATSVYLVDRVVPMLPERLSNFICSLRPNEEKLCFSVVFRINDQAEVLDKWIGRTIINSDHRFTYDEAQQVIETGQGDLAWEITNMDRLAKILRDKRFKAGAIGFERAEVKFKIDENGKPLSVFFKESKDANKLIEEYMLLANKAVAEFIGKEEAGRHSGKKKELTFVYRIHDEPNPDKFESFTRFITRFGYNLSALPGVNINRSLNKLLDDVHGRPEQNIVETLAVRTMAKAVYSTHNVGHYGLGFDHYTHFTSPIRRYPDMMVHRLLQHYLDGGKSVAADEYEDRCEHSSDMEARAADAERASIKYKQVEFLKDRVGQEFDGVISGVTEWGFYVELNENKCEGLVPMRDLDDDFYVFDEENYCIVGRRKHKKYQLGDAIRIVIARANLERKQLDFALPGTIDKLK
ncbi:ribonuclease R [Breznakibacter xylanolyticus]|uniref:Ribonuclease R n=1 Tax=Breznakibacter xylanolyticus TaxID=990 RepID=A0A2W7NPQ3_9BACT|nr:ribonuclease R [Breznakibacter xylanolyticus]PZX18594.1 ribonuclease R [Breznakibacter xylanolyticus]